MKPKYWLMLERKSSKGTFILSKGTNRNTHHEIATLMLKGTLILSKGTNRNTHHEIATLILKGIHQKEHSYYQKELIGILIMK